MTDDYRAADQPLLVGRDVPTPMPTVARKRRTTPAVDPIPLSHGAPVPTPVPEPTAEQAEARTVFRHAVIGEVMAGRTFADLHDELRRISARTYAARIGKRG